MNTVVTLDQAELSEAVKNYVQEHLSAGYKYQFGDMETSFQTTTHGTAFCEVTIEVEPKEGDL